MCMNKAGPWSGCPVSNPDPKNTIGLLTNAIERECSLHDIDGRERHFPRCLYASADHPLSWTCDRKGLVWTAQGEFPWSFPSQRASSSPDVARCRQDSPQHLECLLQVIAHWYLNWSSCLEVRKALCSCESQQWSLQVPHETWMVVVCENLNRCSVAVKVPTWPMSTPFAAFTVKRFSWRRVLKPVPKRSKTAGGSVSYICSRIRQPFNRKARALPSNVTATSTIIYFAALQRVDIRRDVQLLPTTKQQSLVLPLAQMSRLSPTLQKSLVVACMTERKWPILPYH